MLTAPTELHDDLHALFKACHVLHEFKFHFYSYIGSIISSIPSDSVTLIRLVHGLEGTICTTYKSYWDISPDHFESRFVSFGRYDLQEYGAFGVSIRNIAQRYSERHGGLKTRAQVAYLPGCRETRAFEDGGVSFCMTKLEELGSHVTLELDLYPFMSDTEDSG